jgi:broad specificity phosphatase PhoE
MRPATIATLLTLLILSPWIVGAGGILVAQGSEFRTTTVYLVRHAEKAAQPPEDPPLLEAGVTRSRELARVLSEAGITAVYASQFLRTKQTAAPVADRLGLEVETIPVKTVTSDPGGVARESIHGIVEAIYGNDGKTALIVGHSNTIPEVVRALGCENVPAIGDKDYDDLFVVTVSAKGKATLAHLKYGKP